MAAPEIWQGEFVGEDDSKKFRFSLWASLDWMGILSLFGQGASFLIFSLTLVLHLA
jgi:hypothetical protein